MTRALTPAQQAPLEPTKNRRLLASIPDNDHWFQEVRERLHRRNAWSVATASSVAWVVIAISSHSSTPSSPLMTGQITHPRDRHSTTWLWLLCLVICWLWVPTFTHGELKAAIRYANHKTARKAAKRIREKASVAYSSARSKITHGLSKEMSIPTGREKHVSQSVADPIPEIDEENEKA